MAETRSQHVQNGTDKNFGRKDLRINESTSEVRDQRVEGKTGQSSTQHNTKKMSAKHSWII